MKFSAPLGDTVHARFPCSKLKLDNLFLHWLSLQETQKLVISVLLCLSLLGCPIVQDILRDVQKLPMSWWSADLWL